ncbi:Stp1/IreP family PP2C-type Ser/Thr phosphatase [Granulicella arctica]|uniref:Stp1/IreP family PP2C-type Ser/Thr phosphatase n=1 Tax=Granulicella arctica TaxID=940613 RepID=UPI0021DF578B|nr:Stp1/IreP family PP2C-type Ser/Thr phosphatase [Granulicella arctica]
MFPGFNFAMLSSVGRVRSGNEDYCAAVPDRGLFIVCDGMGGAAAGEVASELAANTFLTQMQAALPIPDTTEHLLNSSVQAANKAVHEHASASPGMKGMGTTLVALQLEPAAEGKPRTLWLAHVGDSRCYRLRAGDLTPMTLDHSLVQEQMTAGQLTPEQAERSPMRNIITRAIGSGPRVEPEVQELTPETGDLYLLGSDGLTRDLSDEDLADHLTTADATLESMCQSLIDAANAAGGGDNITVLLLRIEA